MHCLDTNIIIDLFRGDQKIKVAVAQFEHYCITPIVLCELFKGAYLAAKKEEALKLIEEFISSAEIIEFDEFSCRIFGQQYAHLKKQGKLTQEADLMIGSVARAHNAILVTRNPKDFENIQGLKVISV